MSDYELARIFFVHFISVTNFDATLKALPTPFNTFCRVVFQRFGTSFNLSLRSCLVLALFLLMAQAHTPALTQFLKTLVRLYAHFETIEHTHLATLAI